MKHVNMVFVLALLCSCLFWTGKKQLTGCDSTHHLPLDLSQRQTPGCGMLPTWGTFLFEKIRSKQDSNSERKISSDDIMSALPLCRNMPNPFAYFCTCFPVPACKNLSSAWGIWQQNRTLQHHQHLQPKCSSACPSFKMCTRLWPSSNLKMCPGKHTPCGTWWTPFWRSPGVPILRHSCQGRQTLPLGYGSNT